MGQLFETFKAFEAPEFVLVGGTKILAFCFVSHEVGRRSVRRRRRPARRRPDRRRRPGRPYLLMASLHNLNQRPSGGQKITEAAAAAR